MYHDAHGSFPYGVINPKIGGDLSGSAGPNGEYRRQTFVIALWPYIEQGQLYDAYDFDYTFFSEVNRELVNSYVSVYHCPSDPGVKTWEGDQFPRSRGNYVLNWGYGSFEQSEPFFTGAPFASNKQFSIRDLSDGTSRTALMSEMIKPLTNGFDFRGDILNNESSSAQFMTINTPNAGIDSTVCNPQTTDIPTPCRYTVKQYVSARSYHPGGVNLLMADGSVNFIDNSIDIDVWRDISASQSGQVIDWNL
jgi:prepilin-type processing-associated H-X9-DG protein